MFLGLNPKVCQLCLEKCHSSPEINEYIFSVNANKARRVTVIIILNSVNILCFIFSRISNHLTLIY